MRRAADLARTSGRVLVAAVAILGVTACGGGEEETPEKAIKELFILNEASCDRGTARYFRETWPLAADRGVQCEEYVARYRKFHDPRAFRITVTDVVISGAHARARVDTSTVPTSLSPSTLTTATFLLVREAGRWKVDEMRNLRCLKGRATGCEIRDP